MAPLLERLREATALDACTCTERHARSPSEDRRRHTEGCRYGVLVDVSRELLRQDHLLTQYSERIKALADWDRNIQS